MDELLNEAVTNDTNNQTDDAEDGDVAPVVAVKLEARNGRDQIDGTVGRHGFDIQKIVQSLGGGTDIVVHQSKGNRGNRCNEDADNITDEADDEVSHISVHVRQDGCNG